MAHMLEDYLAFARGDSGEQSEATDIAALLEQLQADSERNGHKTTVSFYGPPLVLVRPAAFMRCLAIRLQCGALRRPIAITGHRDHRWLTVTVDDDGPGIPADCARKCSSRSCGSTTRATRTKAAPDWGLPSRSISHARTAATSRSATARLAACAPPCACRCSSQAVMPAKAGIVPVLDQRLGAGRSRLTDRLIGGLFAGSLLRARLPAPRPRKAKESRHRSSSKPTSAGRARARGRAPPACAHDPDRRRRPRCAARERTAARALARASCRAGRRRRCRRRSASMCCERTARPLSASASPGLRARRAHQRAHRRLVRRQRLDAAHQHVEQPLARRLLGHVGIAPASTLRSMRLHVRREDRKRRAELAAAVRRARRRRAPRSRRSRSPRTASRRAAP